MKKKIKLKGQLNLFLKWPIVLSMILILLNALIYTIDSKSGLVMSSGVLLYLVISMLLVKVYRPKLVNEFLSFACQYNTIEQKMIDESPKPYVIMSYDGKIIWHNQRFTELVGKTPAFDKNISNFFPEFKDFIIQKEKSLLNEEEEKDYGEKDVFYHDKVYHVIMKKIYIGDLKQQNKLFQIQDWQASLDDMDNYIVSLHFFDHTELHEAIQEKENNEMVVGLAYLDNYDEALESVEEVRKSLLMALIDRKMNKYFANYDGLVKKMEKDKYLLIIRKDMLEKIKEKNFSIMEDVKNVNIGNEMKVTISIGIGIGGNSYLQNYEYARIAIEMALGRGGDQTVIKNGNNISYYGGKSQTVEKNTRVKARVKAQALKEFISAKERVVVMGHKITDVDAFGAAIGIYRAGKALGKPVHIVINDPTTSIRPLMNTFLECAEYETGMFISSSEAKSLVDNNTVVVVVDTNKPSYTECEDLLKQTKTIVVLDHHRRGNEIIQNAVLSYVEPYASSTCEMVAEILQYFLDGVHIRNIEADSMYAGIMIDTNNFTARAGVRTFEAAAFLRRSGADVVRVRKMLRDNLDSYKARAETIRSAEIYRQNYALGVCPSAGLESPTVVGAQSANELLNIEGVKASFVLTEYRGVVYVSARSIDEINVQVLMEKLGGGGHMNVAGAQIKASVEEAMRMLKAILDETDIKGEEK